MSTILPIKCNLDSGASVNTFPLSFSDGMKTTGNGRVYKTASGELIEDSLLQGIHTTL